MHVLGIRTGNDLKKWSLPLLVQYFGKSGQHYFNIARGIDNRLVTNFRPSKSVGVEITFQEDIEDHATILQQLCSLFDKALTRLSVKQMTAHTLTIKLKYHDFVQITRSRTLPYPLEILSNSLASLEHLLINTEIGYRNVRLLGITLSSLENQEGQSRFQQMDIFSKFY